MMKQFKAISPWAWLLLLICIPAFAATVLWLDDSNPKVSNVGMGIGLCALAAAIGLMVRSEGFFDDRAFHHTLPGGRRVAFLRVSSVLLIVVSLVAAVAMARNAHYHLGWQSTLRAGLIAGSSLGWFTAAVASGFALATHRERKTRWVLIGLILLPVVIYIIRRELWRNPMLPVWGMRASSVLDFSWVALFGMVWFSLVWWLAAGFRRWGLALAVMMGFGVMLPSQPQFRRIRYALPEKLPLSEALLIRQAPSTPPQVEEPGVREGATGPRKILSLVGLLEVDGLRDDEVFIFNEILCRDEPWNLNQILYRPNIRAFGGYRLGVLAQEGEGSGHLGDPIRKTVGENPKFGNPQFDRLRRNEERENWVSLYSEDQDPSNMQTSAVSTIEADEFMDGEWKIDGTVIRFEEIGSVDVATGGRIRFADLGTLRVWPVNESFYSSTISFRLMLPGGDRDAPTRAGLGSIPGFGMTGIRAAVLVDSLRNRAILVETWGGGRSGASGLASAWIDGGIRIDSDAKEDWTTEEIRRSRAYFFTARPVARVEAVLPAPGD